MKRIVLPIEADRYPAECLSVAAQLNSLSPLMLAAAIVPDVDYASLWTVPGGFATIDHLAEFSSDEIEAIDRNCKRIEAFCREQHIRYSIRRDRFDFALHEIRKESRFGDLLFISSRHFFENISAEQPNAYMQEILHHAESPVLLLPDGSGLPEHLIVAYDGSASSVHAIRQFVYLFPELGDRPVTVVNLDEDLSNPMPDSGLLYEWLNQHFKRVEFLQLPMKRGHFLDTWVTNKDNPWLIAGSFGRSGWSQLFAKSFITDTIRRPFYPVFLAHV